MTTSDQSALLAAILADPSQDTPRLAYADWLDENAGEVECHGPCREYIGVGKVPDDIGLRNPTWLDCWQCSGTGSVSNGFKERAEFIRVQVELARLPKEPLGHHERCTEESQYVGCGRCEWLITTYPKCVALRARERELWGYQPRPLPDGIMHEFLRSLPNGWAALLDSDNGSGLTHDYPWAHVSRGFVSQVTCTSANWLRHADSVYRRPGATMECTNPEYDPKLDVFPAPGTTYKRHSKCPHCTGTGRVPRPMPAGAQPLERVVLTTVPDANDGWEFTEAMYFRETENGFDFPVQSFKSDRWPGIVFEVRPLRVNDDGWGLSEEAGRRIAQWIEEEILRGT